MVSVWTPGDHKGHEDHSSMNISSHWVPCEHQVMTCKGSIGRGMVVVGVVVVVVVSTMTVRDEFSVGCQVRLVLHVWKRHAMVLILDCAVVGSSAIVGDLEFPSSLHLKDLGSIGSDGRSHESILHVPVHEISQGRHFGFGQGVHMSAGKAVRSGDHLNVRVDQPVTRVGVLIHRSVHILHIVVPHRLVDSVSIHVVEEGEVWRMRYWQQHRRRYLGIHPAVESAVIRVEDDGASAPGDVRIVGAQPTNSQDDGEERRLRHIKGQDFSVITQVNNQVVRFQNDWARGYRMPINCFHHDWPFLDSQRDGVLDDIFLIDEVAGGARINHSSDEQGVSAGDMDLEHHLQMRSRSLGGWGPCTFRPSRCTSLYSGAGEFPDGEFLLLFPLAGQLSA